ncbi:unnamed protein product, partial [Allacma fusca]
GKSTIVETPVVVILKKYSKLTEPISIQAGWLQNTGHFEKWLQQVIDIVKSDGIHWLKRLRKIGLTDNLGYQAVKMTDEAMVTKTRPFTLEHISLGFLAMAIGIGLAISVFVWEIFEKHLFFEFLCHWLGTSALTRLPDAPVLVMGLKDCGCTRSHPESYNQEGTETE